MSIENIDGYICTFDGKPVLATARATEEKCWQHQLEVLGVTKEVAQARSWDVAPMRMTVGKEEAQDKKTELTILGMKIKTDEQVIVSGIDRQGRWWGNRRCFVDGFDDECVWFKWLMPPGAVIGFITFEIDAITALRKIPHED
jgi:hypothetical protein